MTTRRRIRTSRLRFYRRQWSFRPFGVKCDAFASIINNSIRSGEALAYNDLREFIAALDRAGELKKISAEVDLILEITEIADRVSKGRGGKGGLRVALRCYFRTLKAIRAQVLINQFGSESRMKMALEVDSLNEIADRIRHFMDVKSPQGFIDKVKMLPMLAEMGKFFPKTVSTGPARKSFSKTSFHS